MSPFFSYMLEALACSALFAGFYWCALRNGRFYRWNRFYIVVSVALSIVVPLLSLPLPARYSPLPATADYVSQLAMNPLELTALPQHPASSPVPWSWIAMTLCLLVALFLFAKSAGSLLRILRLKRRSERAPTPEAVLYYTDDADAPFTFFRAIFWKKGISPDSSEGRCMLRHELAHARLGHSWDKALMQLACCLFWMNPFFMLFRRELELVHEFEADSESVGEGNAEELSSLILCTLYPCHYRDFTNRFFQSSIKRRIFMISKNKKTSLSMLRKTSALPVLLLALYLFACKSAEHHAPSESEAPTAAESAAAAEASFADDDEIFIFANEALEAKPMFDGRNAEESFREYIYSVVVYPPEAIEQGISGRVFADFVIEKDGTVSNIRLLRGVDPPLDNETLRAIASSPKWSSPGIIDGKPVRVQYQFQLVFRLNN